MPSPTESSLASSPIVTAVRKSWSKPLKMPQFFTNAMLESWPTTRGERPDSLRYEMIRNFYNHQGQPSSLSKSIRLATENYARQCGDSPLGDNAGVALIFMVRAFSYSHAFHNFLVAHSLRELGYRIHWVVCDGLLESCGSGISGKRSTAPPFLCGECRQLAASFYPAPFSVIHLDELVSVRENGLIRLIEDQTDYKLARLTIDGMPIGRWMLPYLRRYCGGHAEKIDLKNPEMLQHVRGIVRLVCRYQLLLSRLAPSCAVFFNGLFAPESIFYHMSQASGVATLCTEHGPRKNTLFVSSGPACHHHADELWTARRESLDKEQIAEARASINQHAVREVPDSKPYDELAQTPYIALFLPVLHDTASMEKSAAFADIFAAIDAVCEEAIRRGRTLVISPHPNEANMARGAYTVSDHLMRRGFALNPLIRCLKLQDKWNPYRLVSGAQATVVYNGTLGMELPGLGHRIYNLAQSHYAGKGFTEDIPTRADLANIFEATSANLTSRSQEEALRYWYFYYWQNSIPIGSLMDESAPSQFVINPAATPAEITLVRKAVHKRVEFLLNAKLAKVEAAPSQPAT
jgi:hypothetical protein